MRVIAFKVQNFRGIRHASANSLGGTIIIAGQNGSGKSCIFDAMRLLKSVYGGYQQNEWHQWMGEFAINVNSSSQDLVGIFNQKSSPLTLEFNFELHDEERSYLTQNATELLTDLVWRTKLPDAYAYSGYRMAMFASQFRDLEPEVRAHAAEMKAAFETELAQPFVTGQINIQPGGRMNVRDSLVLPVVFTLYRPKNIGVIDYHGAQRHYGREQVQNVNISLDQANQIQSAHALYNYANKYANVKSEMAASYMKEILAEQAGVPRASQSTLTATLKELFETFFPDKKFLGPIPTTEGGLSFPVETLGGTRHDLDDLSAGEKEILYGYLRIRNSAPRFSVILIDEPELHLNPRLIRGLPQFYRKNLGVALDNQIWLVTHSDALLREAVGKDGFHVFHMQPCSLVSSSTGHIGINNQLKPLEVKNDVDLALADLVGDLAAFQPDRKVVIFEGGGDSDFDRWMTSTLFPDFYSKYNLISGSNKNKVKALHEVLNRAFEHGDIKTQFYAIVDSDYDTNHPPSQVVNRYAWPVYHIENFLLDTSILSQVVSPLFQNAISEEDVLDALKSCARSTVPKAIRHRVTEYASKQLTQAIDLGFDPSIDDVGSAIHSAAARSIARSVALEASTLSLDALKEVSEKAKTEIESAFADGTWLTKLPGRDILRAYSNSLPTGISHETLRLMIVNKMADLGYQPPGMTEILNKIQGSGN
jgi:predicted ATPase